MQFIEKMTSPRQFCLAFPIRVPGIPFFCENGEKPGIYYTMPRLWRRVCSEENFHYGHDVRLTQIRHR
jgi:hypothetical protein